MKGKGSYVFATAECRRERGEQNEGRMHARSTRGVPDPGFQNPAGTGFSGRNYENPAGFVHIDVSRREPQKDRVVPLQIIVHPGAGIFCLRSYLEPQQTKAFL